MRKRASSAARAGYNVRRWTCAVFLLYRVLAYSAGRLIAAAAYQFLRYRGRVRNENLAVFLPYRLVQMLTVRRCVARTDFLPYRIAEKPARMDVLLPVAEHLSCSEPAQRCCAAARIRSVPSVPVRCCCDTIFLPHRPADWCCAADSMLLLFLPRRAKQSHRDSAPTRCCAGWIPTGNVRPVPAAYSA